MVFVHFFDVENISLIYLEIIIFSQQLTASESDN